MLIRRVAIASLALVAVMFTGVVSAAPESAGREQLVQALDAGWVRYVESGDYEADIAAFVGPQGLAASDYVINQADCLPQPENVEFPDNPKGRFAEILDVGTIRRGTPFGFSPFPGAATADYFSPLNEAMVAGVIGAMEEHYGITINVQDVVIGVPFNTTSALLDGVFNNPFIPFAPADDPDPVDFVGQFNALGGETEGSRRRDTRRFTCAMSSSGQYIHLTAGVSAGIDSLADLRAATIANPAIQICTGPLSTQTIRSYLPEANAAGQIHTENLADIVGCLGRVADGFSNVYVNSLPELPPYAAPAYDKTVFTSIVAGTPYWVAKEGVVCNQVGPFPFMRACELGND